MMARLPMDGITEEGGVRTTPNLASPGSPCLVGSSISVTNGIEGSGAFFFDAPVDGSVPVGSYVLFTNELATQVEDVTLTMWQKRDRFMDQSISTRPFVGAGLFNLLTFLGTNTRVKFDWFNYSLVDAIGKDEEWVHMALKFEFFNMHDGTRNVPRVRIKSYRNGEYVSEAIVFVSQGLQKELSGLGAKWMFGSSCDLTSAWRGAMDDVRLYVGSLTGDEIREIYRGPARTDAGEDFTVAGPAAELHGACSPHSGFRLSPDYAGEPVWTLVSAPVGGEGAIIENPKALATKVSLPAPGSYVFVLSNEVWDAHSVDTVTVTRNDAAAGVGASLSPVVKNQSGLCAVISAGAPTGVRVRWTKLSGSGGVWFAQDAANETLVTFSAAGDYTLHCVGSDGTEDVERTLELTVTGSSVAEQFADGLQAYWSCDYNETTDEVKGYQLSSSVGFSYTPGVGNTYALRNGFGETEAESKAYFGTTMPGFPNGKDAGGVLPMEEWYTLSCWMYHDGNDPNPTWAAALASINLCKTFFYLPKLGASSEFEIAQAKPDGSVKTARFKGPTYSLTNRWTHVVMQVNQKVATTGGVPDVWVDGVKMEMLRNDTGNSRCLPTNYLFSLGGAVYTHDFGSDEGGAHFEYKYRFPGSLDEVRIYGRHLSEAEIRYLYEYPTATKADLAPSVTVQLSEIKMMQRTSSDPVDASAYADNPDADLVYSWRVLSGDASAVSFSDPAALKPVVSIKRGGEYKLQLVVSDGVRKTHSEPVLCTVERTGMTLLIR